MKNHRFILEIFCGILLSTFIFIMVSFKSEPTGSLLQTPTKLMSFDNYGTTDIYKLRIGNYDYIVVNNGKGGAAIIKVE